MEENLDREAVLAAFGAGLEAEAEKQIGLRQPIEDRWVEDVRRFHGQYSAKQKSNFQGTSGSQQFVNVTRPKTNAGAARLQSTLFPTDERNFGIAATPVPEGQEDFKECAELMEDEIADQLSECDYDASGRDAIYMGCLVGTGVLKGPVLITSTKHKWRGIPGAENNPDIAALRTLETETETKPGVEFVPTWDYFPDMTAVRRKDCEFEFFRHYMTKRDLVELLKRKDFDAEQIRKLLETEPRHTPPSHLAQLREMGGVTSVGEEKKYLVWERHGSVSRDTLAMCGCDVEEETAAKLESVVFVSNGIVIKADVSLLDTKERPISVWCYEEDPSCIFGFGIPYLIKNPQDVVNSSFRMIMDNSGMSVAGQTIINDTVIEPVPVNGVISWEVTAGKTWRLRDKNKKPQDAFHIFEFPNHQQELSAIFQTARQLCDEETMLPVIAQGEQSPGITKTAHGMEMLMNAANSMMRKPVKSWDDNITDPLITRFYNYNMQFSKKEEIKGDLKIIARGTSALLIKETQTKNLLNLVNFANTPALAPLTNWEGIYKSLIEGMDLDPEKIIIPEDDRQQGEQGPDLEEMNFRLKEAEIKSKYQDRDDERNFKAQLAQFERETALIKLATEQKMSVEKLKAMILNTEIKGKIDRSKIADEYKIKLATGSGI